MMALTMSISIAPDPAHNPVVFGRLEAPKREGESPGRREERGCDYHDDGIHPGASLLCVPLQVSTGAV